MADEEDRERPASPVYSSDPAAWAALGAASREKADAFLEKQTRLVDLQAKELAHELRLHHWSLRVRHVSDVMKVAFEFALAVMFLGVIAIIGSAVWNAAHDNGAVIEAFSVPPDLAAKGITGEVVAAKVLDRLTAMQVQTSSARATSSYSRNWGDNIKVQIPDTGVSLGEFNRYLHEWLGHETRITGQVYRTENGLAVSARASGAATPVFEGEEHALDALIDKAAKAVYRITQPYRYSVWLWTHDKTQTKWTAEDTEADAVMNQLIATGSVEDRIWSLDGIGMHKRKFGDFYGAVEWIRKSIAAQPGLDAYVDLANMYAILQHNEQELAARLTANAIASQGADTDTDPQAAEELTFVNKANLALLKGDALEAQADMRRLHAIPGADPNYDYYGDLVACGLLHDAACARATEEAHPVPAEYRRVADITLGRFKAAADEQAAARTLFVSFGEFGAALALRFDDPESALAAAHQDNFRSAHGFIDKTPLDCDQCLQYRGRIDVLEKNRGGAAYWFARAAKAAPSIPYTYTDWGELLLHEGHYDGAIAKFALANQKGPHFADPLEMWGEALMQENRSDLALAKFEEADKYAPNWSRLHLEWGKALVYTGRKDEAKTQFAIALHLDLSADDRATPAKWITKQ